MATDLDDEREPKRTPIRGLSQAYDLRDLSAATAMQFKDAPLEDGETRASRAQAICALVRAWSEATSTIRILRGKPLPGSLRPEKKQPKRKLTRAVPSEHPSSPSDPPSEKPQGDSKGG